MISTERLKKIKGQLNVFRALLVTNNVIYEHFIVRTLERLICDFIPAVDALIVIRQDSLLNINSSGTIKNALKHWTQIKGVKESGE